MTEVKVIPACEGVRKRGRSKDQASVNREAPTHDTPMASPQAGGDSIRRVFLTLRRSIN